MLLLSIAVLLLLAAGSFVGANFLDPGPAQQSLCGLGGALVGLTLPQVPALFRATPLTTIALIAGLSSLAFNSGCHNTKPDALFGATVDCAKINPENSAAKTAVINCLTGIVMSNTSACVTGLVVGMKYDDPEIESKVKIRWVIDEVACVTSWVAQQENAKVGTLNEGPHTQPTRNAAIDWLAGNHISIRNSYSEAP